MLESPPKVPAGTFSVPTVPVEHRSRDRIGPNTYRRPTPPHLRWPDCTFSPIHGLSGPRAPINHRRDPAVTQSLAIPPVVGPWQAYTRSYRRPSDRVPPAGQALRNTQPMHHCTDPCSWSWLCPARWCAGFGGVSCYSTGHTSSSSARTTHKSRVCHRVPVRGRAGGVLNIQTPLHRQRPPQPADGTPSTLHSVEGRSRRSYPVRCAHHTRALTVSQCITAPTPARSPGFVLHDPRLGSPPTSSSANTTHRFTTVACGLPQVPP